MVCRLAGGNEGPGKLIAAPVLGGADAQDCGVDMVGQPVRFGT